MKKYLPLLLVLILSVACKKEQKTTTTTTTTTAPPAKTSDVTTNSDGTVHVKSNHSAFLVGMWQYGFFIGPDSEKEKYKGRWIKFNRDDTFVSGQYEEETNKGTYVYEHSPNNVLTINYEKDEPIYRQWSVQNGSAVTLFKGQTELNPSRFNIKMDQITTLPKKN